MARVRRVCATKGCEKVYTATNRYCTRCRNDRPRVSHSRPVGTGEKWPTISSATLSVIRDNV